MLGFNIFVVFLLVLFVAFVMAGVKVVPQGWTTTQSSALGAIRAP